MNRLDPRSPMVFSTLELGRRPGTMQELTRRIEAPEAIGTDVIAVPAESPLEVGLRLESVLEGVLATGEVRATATGSCVRCLEPVTASVTAPFQELFVHPERVAHHRKTGAVDEQTEEYEVQGDHIDLEPVLVDAVVLALPFQPVCRPDCPGLCSECGARLADDPGHHHELLDPRWSQLTALSSSVDADHTQEKRN